MKTMFDVIYNVLVFWCTRVVHVCFSSSVNELGIFLEVNEINMDDSDSDFEDANIATEGMYRYSPYLFIHFHSFIRNLGRLHLQREYIFYFIL